MHAPAGSFPPRSRCRNRLRELSAYRDLEGSPRLFVGEDSKGPVLQEHYFPNERDRKSRPLPAIITVIRIARPIMPDGRIRSYLRNLRWSRDDPSRFLGFLGIQTFDRLGGWFLFYGTKGQQVGGTDDRR